MDRKTKSILNNVTRELFEASTNMPVENPNLPPDLAQQLQFKEETARLVNAVRDTADHFKEAEAIRNQIASDKVRRAIGDVADQFRDERNAAISRGASPDAWTAGDEDEARDIVYQTAKSKLIPERNPHTGPDPMLSKMGNVERDYEIARHNPKTGYDPALGELNDADVPWYQQGWQWVQDNPGYAALAAGAPLALTGAYMLGKHRASKK